MNTLKKLILLSTVPMFGIQAFAAPTRTRIEVKPGMTGEARTTARTKGADSVVRENSAQSLEAFRAQPAPAARASVVRSSDALTEDGVAKINDFNARILGKILEYETEKNVFITGPALFSAVTMLSNGANDRAKAELLRALGYGEGDLEKLNSQSSSLLSRMNQSSEAVTIKMANAFFADESLPVVPAYKNLVQSRLKATVQNVKFATESEAAAQTINKWANDNTDGMIKSIVDKDGASQLAALLASAVYFKGKWASQFDPKKTYEDAFNLENGQTVTVPMMHGEMDIEAVFNHDQKYLIARLPYRGKTSSMYIVFPTARGGKPTITAAQALLLASNSGELSLFQKGSEKVQKMEGEDVVLPKFAIKYSNGELKKIFEAMGVDKVFHGGSLTNLSPDQRLKVSYIKMDTALEVDEEGAKAAGVASIGMVLESVRMPQFVFDRPFGIVIRDDASGIDLFSGVIRNPKP